MGKGGGSRAAAPTEQTVVQSNLPKYFEPYALDMLQRAESESKREYTPYEGQRLAGDAADIVASRGRVRDIAGSGIAGMDTAMAGTQAGMGRALQGLGFTADEFDSGIAQKYMSPYMQNVLNIQKEQAIRDFQRGEDARRSQQIQAGAFGGSRGAVQDALAQADLERKLGEIQATGQQKAFEDAQMQFQRDREAAAQAEQIGLKSAESLAGQAGQIAQLGDLARKGDIQAAELLEKIGKDIQAREQAGLDVSYEDFVRQRDFPKEQLQFLSSILRGVPVQPSTETSKFQQYNPVKDLLGTGIAGLGLYRGITGG